MPPSTGATVIDLGVVRAERARQKRRAELATARRTGRFYYVAPIYPVFGYRYHAAPHLFLMGLTGDVPRPASSRRSW